MFRSLRPLAFLLSLLVARGASAQSFQGLDSPQQPKKKAKKSTSSSKARRAARPRPAPRAGQRHHAGHDRSRRRPGEGHRCRAAGPRARPVGVAAEAGAGQAGPADAAASPVEEGDRAHHDLRGAGRLRPTADRQRLEAANASFNRGEYEKAALAAWELMNDPKMAPGSSSRRSTCSGKTLYRMGMYHSALGEFCRILATGPDTKFFKTVAGVAVLHQPQDGERVGDPRRDRQVRQLRVPGAVPQTSSTTCWRATTSCAAGRWTRWSRRPRRTKSFEEAKQLALTIPHERPVLRPGQVPRGPHLLPRRKDAHGARGDEGGGPRHPARRRPDRRGREAGGRDCVSSPSCSWRAPTTARGRTATPSTTYGKIERGNAAVAGGAVRVRAGPTTASASTSRRWGTSSPCPVAVLPRRVLPRGADPEGGHLLRELPLRGVAAHPPGLRAHLHAGPRRSWTLLREEEHGGDGVLQGARRHAEEEPGGREASQSTDIILERVLKLALTRQGPQEDQRLHPRARERARLLRKKSDTFKYTDLPSTSWSGSRSSARRLIQKAGLMAKAKLEHGAERAPQLLGNGLRIKFETTTKEKEFLEEQLQAGGAGRSSRSTGTRWR